MGTWVVTATSNSDAVAKGTKFTFEGDGVTRTGTNGKTAKGLFTVDVKRKPQTIDMVFADGAKDKMYGVYSFVAGGLRINYAPDVADRPTGLDVEKNKKKWTLLVLARVNR